MSGNNSKQWMLSAALAAILISCSFSAFAGDDKRPTHKKTNINLAVASNFYGIPPNNSAITDIINAFESANPGDTVTVTDNGATATLEANIINGNVTTLICSWRLIPRLLKICW